ncbi:MAG: hypothetical protein KDD46_00860 [Bdellovibrionales bacterium]|nr:hypothetical protein [Bdellovibrionales bacterium]
MKLTNIRKQEVHFSREQTIEFFKGSVVSDQDHEIFQYSISTQPHLGFYRTTLSFEHLDIRNAGVFLIHPEDFSIKGENETAQNLLCQPENIKYKQIKEAIEMILKKHVPIS